MCIRDRANGPYFIKTETDPSGGTNYTITGTSQLNSVPYALFSANSSGGAGWGLSGNSGTNPETNFIGTTDEKDVVFKRDNVIACLLYTSDAADERSSVDLGGRRIIKKKKEQTNEDGASRSKIDNYITKVDSNRKLTRRKI